LNNEQKDQSTAIIWDSPTRIFHWLLVTSFAIAWISYDDNRFLFFHVYGGYVFFGLLIFRLIWGIIGTHYARFHTFAYDWSSVWEYIKGLLNGKAARHIGHNPIGGWAIFLMLALGFLVSIAGILTFGGEEGHGPMRGWVNFEIGMYAREAHEILAWTMLAVTVVHLLGVIIESLIHKDNLIWAMFTGRKDDTAGVVGVRGHHFLGLTIAAVVFISAGVYFRGYLTETADHLYMPYKGPDLPDSAQWRDECGSCHFAFHPTLLPKRSWQAIFKDQHEHFGDDLDLDEDTYQELLAFHVENAAESKLSEPAHKVLLFEDPNSVPIRVTDTKYWKHKHEDIDDVYWKSKKVRTKGNCTACHLDAKQGTFEDSDMRLPRLDSQEKAGENAKQ